MQNELVKQILSKAFEEMLMDYEDYVKEQVLIERSCIYADGYFDAVNNVLKIIDKMPHVIDRKKLREEVVDLKGDYVEEDEVLDLKGE